MSAANPEILLHDIANFFADLKPFPHHLVYRTDGIIQTTHGCYRLAYEPPQGPNGKPYIALFYGRHPDDLAGDPTAAEDESDILYKDRMIAIEMREVPCKAPPRWKTARTRSRSSFAP